MTNEYTESVDQSLWRVAENGYKWLKTTQFGVKNSKPQQFITSGFEYKEEYKCLIYSPLKMYPGIFKTFAETPINKNGVLAFVNTYGLLGSDISVLICDDENSTVLVGEPLNIWKEEITKISHVIHLFELIKAKKEYELSKYILWGKNKSVSYKGKLSSQMITSNNHMPGRFIKYVSGDVIAPAEDYIMDIVNKSLQSKITTKLLRDDDQPGYFVVPTSLIGVIWHQYAKYFNGEEDFRQCGQCKKWFTISPKPNRKIKKYCSIGCKLKAYRERQSLAQNLHTQGVSIKEIANQLDSDPKTVKGWINEGASK